MRNTELLKHFQSFKHATLEQDIESLEKNPLRVSSLSYISVVDDEIELSGPQILDDYLEDLRDITETLEVDLKYYRKPRHWCQKVYGVGELWSITLWLNSMAHPYEFTFPEVLAITPSAPSIKTFLEIFKTMQSQVGSRPVLQNSSDAYIIKKIV